MMYLIFAAFRQSIGKDMHEYDINLDFLKYEDDQRAHMTNLETSLEVIFGIQMLLGFITAFKTE